MSVFFPGYVFCNCLRCHWTSNIFDWELFTYGLRETASRPFCDAFCQAVFTCTCQDSGIRIHFAQILMRISLGCLTVLKQNVIKVDNDQDSAVSHHWQGTVKYRWKVMICRAGSSCCSRVWLVLSPGLCSSLQRAPEHAAAHSMTYTYRKASTNDLLPATATFHGPGGRSIH